MDIETTRLLKRGLPLFTTLAGALLFLVLAAILHLGREIFVPVALAGLFSFLLAPGVRVLQRAALPQGLAVLVTVVLAFGAISGLALLIGSQLSGLGRDLPRYQVTIRDKIASLGTAAAPGGAISEATAAIGEIGRELNTLGGGEGDIAGPTGETKQPMAVVIQDKGGLIGLFGLFVSPLLQPLATAGLVLIFVVFILSAREDLRNRFVRLLGTDDIQHTTAVIDDAARRLSRLFLMQFALNVAFGAVIASGLVIIGIPSPILWGILAGVLRFVPYLGAIAGSVAPLALGFAVDPGWSMLIETAVLFAVVETIVGQVLEPLLFGHSTGLSPVAVILSALIWTFLWGPIGLVMATPLTVCLIVLGRHVGGLNFLDVMLGDRPALSPPQLFYQRMLAGDPTEAVLQAKDFLRERALSTYYDEVALEALRLAHEDVARGRLTPARQAVLRRSTEMLVGRLDTVRDPRPKGGQVGREAAAAVVAVGPDLRVATEVLSPSDLRPDWRGGAPVICFARTETLDAVIATMVTQVLTKHGVPARTITYSTAPEAAPPDVSAADVRLVCLSYLEPLSTLHLRHAVRVARRQFPLATVVLGIWRERDMAVGRMLVRASRADAVVPSTGAALHAVLHAARRPDASIGVPVGTARDPLPAKDALARAE